MRGPARRATATSSSPHSVHMQSAAAAPRQRATQKSARSPRAGGMPTGVGLLPCAMVGHTYDTQWWAAFRTGNPPPSLRCPMCTGTPSILCRCTSCAGPTYAGSLLSVRACAPRPRLCWWGGCTNRLERKVAPNCPRPSQRCAPPATATATATTTTAAAAMTTLWWSVAPRHLTRPGAAVRLCTWLCRGVQVGDQRPRRRRPPPPRRLCLPRRRAMGRRRAAPHRGNRRCCGEGPGWGTRTPLPPRPRARPASCGVAA
jgi:hypothetical protein